MRRRADYISTVVMVLLSLALVCTMSVSIGLAIRNTKTSHELNILRMELNGRIDKEREEYLDLIYGLTERVESETYVNQRRYSLISDEIKTINNKNNE